MPTIVVGSPAAPGSPYASDDELATHGADTSTHGIVDTADLLVTADLTEHNAATTAHGAATAYRKRQSREQPAGWSQVDDGLGELRSSGLTTTGDWLAASVGGTDGSAILPVWGTPAGFRASFVVKATKATALSKSVVGWTVSAKDTLPSGANHTFSAGYLAGTGIAIVRENVGAAQVILADASITDGEEYTVSVYYYPPIVAGTTGSFSAMVYDAAGARVGYYSSSLTLANFAFNNILVRTNVTAGGLKSVVITRHLVGQGLACNTFLGDEYLSTGDASTLWIPPNPNGHLVIAMHGHGGTPVETGWTSSAYSPVWDALTAAGYSVIVPNMGGNLWGNTTALAHVVTAYDKLVAAGFEEDVFVYGFSMGGGAAATFVSDGTVPVRAVYLGNPVLDYTWAVAEAGFTASMNAAYPTSALRNAADPMQRTAASYAGCGFLIVSSPDDTDVDKTDNSTPFAARISGSTEVQSAASTGVHNDADSFRALTCVNWFNAHR